MNEEEAYSSGQNSLLGIYICVTFENKFISIRVRQIILKIATLVDREMDGLFTTEPTMKND